jgi:hypothetical protein
VCLLDTELQQSEHHMAARLCIKLVRLQAHELLSSFQLHWLVTVTSLVCSKWCSAVLGKGPCRSSACQHPPTSSLILLAALIAISPHHCPHAAGVGAERRGEGAPGAGKVHADAGQPAGEGLLSWSACSAQQVSDGCSASARHDTLVLKGATLKSDGWAAAFLGVTIVSHTLETRRTLWAGAGRADQPPGHPVKGDPGGGAVLVPGLRHCGVTRPLLPQTDRHPHCCGKSCCYPSVQQMTISGTA